MNPIRTTRSGEVPGGIVDGAVDESEAKAGVRVNEILNRDPAVGQTRPALTTLPHSRLGILRMGSIGGCLGGQSRSQDEVSDRAP